MNPQPLPDSYFQQEDVVALARALVGKLLVSEKNGRRCIGRITETEAYRGWGDRACHAHLGRKTKRTQIMYQAGGVAYVYLCYGIHHLFNIVTNVEGSADAILIRAAEPLEGFEHMLLRRNMTQLNPRVSSGPGNLSQAFGIDQHDYGHRLSEKPLVIAQAQPPLKYQPEVQASSRIGIDYAGPDAALPWRFYDARSSFVSKA